METKDIYYVAGILEGEGHFGLSNGNDYPRISLTMTDEDVVIKIRNIMNPKMLIHKSNRNPLDWKDQYVLRINSHHAVGWMMTLFPLMSARRKEQIKQVLSSWRKSSSRFFSKATGDNLLRVLSRKFYIPKPKVRSMLVMGQIKCNSLTGRYYLCR